MKDVQEQEVAQINMKRIQEGAFLVVQAHDRKNVMTIGWAMFGYIWRRSTMLVAVRNSRFTYGIIEEADSFSVSIPTGNMQKEINFCGSKSGKNFDKFKECHFGTIKSKKVSSPLLEIPGYHYQCRILYKTPMDPRFLANDLEQIYPAKDYHTPLFRRDHSLFSHRMTLNHLSKGPQLKNGENLPSPTIRFSRGWRKRKQSSNIKKASSLQHGIKTKY